MTAAPNVVELVRHTPDGEHIHVDPWARIDELELELAQAIRDRDHYIGVVRLLCHKFATAEL